MKIGIFIFTRDLRLVDNVGLIELSKSVDIIIPIFVFINKQIINNKYKSEKQISFMKNCLNDLNESLIEYKSKLFTFYDSYTNVLRQLFDKMRSISHVSINEDYTPFSFSREKEIKNICDKNGIQFDKYKDYLLIDPENPKIRKNDGNVYSKFTPFFNKARHIYCEPDKTRIRKFIKTIPKIKSEISINTMLKKYDDTKIIGRRSNAIKLLNQRKHNYKYYNKSRNILCYSTSGISPYIKFGCISIREIMNYFRRVTSKDNELIKQLYWREFYYHIAIEHPYVMKNKNYNPKYDNVEWNKPGNILKKWKNGTTGIPLVDAGMRELNNTGIMHNRARLVVASFLTKNMFLHWTIGEKYFATKLIDYDPIVNNGNWQWCSGSGIDSQPYFRIFNPFTQSAKYDNEAKYIKKWIPELINVPAKHIHTWDTSYPMYNTYIKPILSCSTTSKEAIIKLKKFFS